MSGIGLLSRAVSRLPPRPNIVTAMAASEPYAFYQNLHELVKMPQMHGATIYCANPTQRWTVFEAEAGAHCAANDIRIAPLFLSHEVRDHQSMPHVHYVPGHLSAWETNIVARCSERRVEEQGLNVHVPRSETPISTSSVDLFVGTCSKPDPRGFVSLGVSNCYESGIARLAKQCVLEVSDHMPQVGGSMTLALGERDVGVEPPQLLEDGPRRPLPTYTKGLGSEDPRDRRIAELCSEMIADGSTVQFGIGGIPNALASLLKCKKDLGVHTEMINDAVLDLVKSGTVNGRRKTMWPEKVIGCFAFGSEELYDWLHLNPFVELHPGRIVNDPVRIGNNHLMTSVNSAVEVSITGQVCSESVGHRELSGVGGATDTHIGSQRAAGGRGIVALHSTTKILKLCQLEIDALPQELRTDAEEISGRVGMTKIALQLAIGAKVSISRNDIDTVVTEHGVAKVKGCTVERRAQALTAIAHPEWRSFLKHAAVLAGYR